MTLQRPPSWTLDAACIGMAGREFDPWHDQDRYRLARRVCSTCAVRYDCALMGLAGLPLGLVDGMYGGLTPAELADVARTFEAPDHKVAQHGTRSRYVAGPCEGFEPHRCPACTEAHRRYESQRRDRHRFGLIPQQRQPLDDGRSPASTS